jgi:sigma-E factor negative regulatory protein RseA
MTEEIQQQLSALMDGELDRDATRFLLKRMDSDASLAQRWSRYHIARACLRRQGEIAVGVDIASAVMQRIASESAAVPIARRFAPLLRWGAGGAIAAAVTVAALVVSRPSTLHAPEIATAAATAPVQRTAETRQEPRSPMQQQPPLSMASFDYGSPMVADPRLESYLIRHYQATGTPTRSGFVPYVFLVAPTQQNAGSGEQNPQQDKSTNVP